MNKIILLILTSFLYVQWVPFHPVELTVNQDNQIDYYHIDQLAIEIPLDNSRVSLSHEIIGYLPYWEYDQYPYLDYNLLTQINYFSAELSQFGDIVNDHNWENLSIVNFAHERGVKLKLCATLFGAEPLRNLLSSPFNRQNAINNLIKGIPPSRDETDDNIDISDSTTPQSVPKSSSNISPQPQ